MGVTWHWVVLCRALYILTDVNLNWLNRMCSAFHPVSLLGSTVILLLISVSQSSVRSMHSRKIHILNYTYKQNSIFWCHSSIINDWVQRWLFPDIKQAWLCFDIQNHILNPRTAPKLIKNGFSMFLACSTSELTALKSLSSLTATLSSVC